MSPKAARWRWTVKSALASATKKRFANGDDIGTICRDFCFAGNLVMRASHDRMLLSPPLVVTHDEIDEIVDKASAAIDATARAITRAA